MTSERTRPNPATLGARMDALPALAVVRGALQGERAFLVGGAVRDLLIGASRVDLDIAIEGDAIGLARRLGAVDREHERFATAAVQINGTSVDIAATRTESYPAPGALPEVSPASLEADLARRDFSINAMAVPLAGEPELVDPHDGLRDLAAGVLRVLHERSFADDPTRALRAARYCARLGLELEARTAELLARVELADVSGDRVEAELRRAAAEADPAPVFALLAGWDLAGIDHGAPGRIGAVLAVHAQPGWGEILDPVSAVRGAAQLDPTIEAAALRLASSQPARPSEAAELARGRSPLELLAGRSAGAIWLDEYIQNWRHVALEIDGDDLLAAGIPQGPAVGRDSRPRWRQSSTVRFSAVRMSSRPPSRGRGGPHELA